MKAVILMSTWLLVASVQQKPGNDPIQLPWRPKALAINSKDELFVAFEDMLLVIAPNGSSRYATENISAGFRGSRAPACDMMVFDSKNNLYMAGSNSSMIWKMDTTGNITLFAGQGTFRGVRKDGPRSEADFVNIRALAIDPNDNLLVMEEAYSEEKRNGRWTFVLRTVTPDGTVTTTMNADGTPRLFTGFTGLAVTPAGEPIFFSNNCICKLNADGSLESMAGQCKGGVCPVFKPGPLATAQIAFPSGITFNKKGVMYISALINRILKIENNQLQEVAGGEKIDKPCFNTVSGTFGGYRDGKATTALFQNPGTIVFDSKENLFILETANGAIRKLSPDGWVSTVARLASQKNSTR
jgi:hypothetical protein